VSLARVADVLRTIVKATIGFEELHAVSDMTSSRSQADAWARRGQSKFQPNLASHYGRLQDHEGVIFVWVTNGQAEPQKKFETALG